MTASHFVSIYCSEPMSSILLSQAFLSKRTDGKPVMDYFVSFCDFFINLLSSQYKYKLYRPSLQAAACFITARRVLHIK